MTTAGAAYSRNRGFDAAHGHHAGAAEKRHQREAEPSSDPHAAPCQGETDQKVAPPAFDHLVADQSLDQWIEPAVSLDQLVAMRTANVKKTCRFVVDEPCHGLWAECPIDDRLADARKAIGERQHELPRGHVVEGEALDQRGGAVLLRQSPFSRRDGVADEPWADDHQPCEHECKPVEEDRAPSHRRKPDLIDRDQSDRDRRQHDKRWPGQAQQARTAIRRA